MLSTLPNLLRRRELIGVLVRTELQTQAAGTRLGWLWWLLDPVLTMVVYVVLFTVLFTQGRRYAPFPLFLLCGLLPWRHLSTSMVQCTEVLRKREPLLTSVPFPSLVLPLATVLSQAVYLVFGLCVLLVAGAYFDRPITSALLQVPILLLLQVALVAGIGMALACLGVLVRDLSRFMEHLLRFGLYCSPILYGVDLIREQVGEKAANLFMLNPMALLITGYRDAVFYGNVMEASYWGLLVAETAIILPAGYLLYRAFDGRLIKYL